jgi:hypothetical protein
MDAVRRGRTAGPWGLDVSLEGHPDVHVRTTVVSPDTAEAILARGRPPGGGVPYELQWMLLNARGPMGFQTDFVQVLEAYEGARVLETVRLQRLESVSGSGARCVGVQVTSGDRRDALFFGRDPSAAARGPEGVSFSGRFGMWSTDGDGLREVFLAEGTRIARGRAALELPQASFQAEVTAVDYAGRTLTIGHTATPPAALIGRTFRITNDGGSDTAYRVVDAHARPSGTEIEVDVDPRIAEGHARDAEENLLIGSVELPLGNYGYYAGKTLVNEDGDVRYRTSGARRRTGLYVDPDAHGSVSADTLRKQFSADAGRPPRRYVVYDYGIGDTVRFWHQASAVRTDTGYRVTATSPGTLTLADGTTHAFGPGTQHIATVRRAVPEGG